MTLYTVSDLWSELDSFTHHCTLLDNALRYVCGERSQENLDQLREALSDVTRSHYNVTQILHDRLDGLTDRIDNDTRESLRLRLFEAIEGSFRPIEQTAEWNFHLHPTDERLQQVASAAARIARNENWQNSRARLRTLLDDIASQSEFYQRFGNRNKEASIPTAANAELPQPTNCCEQNIMDALREYGSLKGEPLAKRSGYDYNSHFKGTLSSLRKRGVIENTPGEGYHLPKSQDHGQD